MKIGYVSLIMIGTLGAAHAQDQSNQGAENFSEGRVLMGVDPGANTAPLVLDNHGSVNSNVVTITPDALAQIRDACKGK